MSFVVVGAGPTGVEMAGQIAELSRRTLKRDFRYINSKHARTILLDAAPQVLPPFGSAGRIGVNPDLTLPGYPEVFVVGDMISLNNLPGVAQVAIQGAKYAAKEIDGRLRGRPPQPAFKYF